MINADDNENITNDIIIESHEVSDTCIENDSARNNTRVAHDENPEETSNLVTTECDR